MQPGLYWGDINGMPTLDTYAEKVHVHRLITYLKRRDQYRVVRGLPPKWEGRSVAHAALTWELATRGSRDQSRVLRILWDWYQHGGNKKKNNTRHNGRCKLCDQLDSQEHWTMLCGNLACQSIRMVTDNEIDKFVNEQSEHDDSRKIAEYVTELALRQDTGYMIRLGFYSKADVQLIKTRFPAIYSVEQGRRIKTILVGLGIIWAEGISRLYDHKIRGGKKYDNSRYYKGRDHVRQAIKDTNQQRLEKQKAKPKKKGQRKKNFETYQALSGCLFRPKAAAGELRAREGVG